ncbi:MAG: triose-phosphate isomerase, partial [Gammaproteobacteria bacterium]
MKPYFVAANWKMNGSKKLVVDLIEALQVVESDLLDIGLFLPSPYMAEATAMVGQTMIVGAQHVSQ